MQQLFVFILKEFTHVLRDPKTLLMLFGLPIAQIILFGFALSNEVKNSDVAVFDQAGDAMSLQLIQKVEASQYFTLRKSVHSTAEVEAAFKNASIKMALVIPAHFADDLQHAGTATVQLIANASDPNNATALTSYMSSVIGDFQAQQRTTAQPPMQIVPEVRMLYNPELRGAPNFVPGVMALLLMLVCTMMSSVAIVREKELGTMEILLVSPFKPVYIIISKLMPFLIIAFVDILIILVLSTQVLDLQIKGSIFLLLMECTLFIITSLAIGLLISVGARTQQAAMTASLMGMMLPTMLLTGFMFPIENMPLPMRLLSNIVPSRWFFIIVKNVMLKGLGLDAIWKETLILFSMASFLLFFSFKKFKIRLQS
jgi:ABC-2 type transport system permease protein